MYVTLHSKTGPEPKNTKYTKKKQQFKHRTINIWLKHIPLFRIIYLMVILMEDFLGRHILFASQSVLGKGFACG